MNETKLREQIVLHGESLFRRGYGCGSSGNISVKIEDGWLITPTNSCLGRLDPARISKMNEKGQLISGDSPSKEAFLHLAMYEQRKQTGAVVHLHSTYSVCVSCLSDVDSRDVLPPITAYYIMRVGHLPLVPYYRPGDLELAEAVRQQAQHHHAMLLANHGPVVAGQSLDAAVYAAEELEETAKLFILLRSQPVRYLTQTQVAELREAFPA